MKCSSIGDAVVKKIFTILKTFGRDEGGAVLVEMTVITPLMILLSAGVFEFSNLIHQKLLIEAGLHDAARYYARCNEGLYEDDGDEDTSIDCDSNAQDIALYGLIGGGTPRVGGWSGPVLVSIDLTANNTDPNTGLQDYRYAESNVETVRITTSFSYAGTGLFTYLVNRLGLSPIILSAAHEERYIGW